MKSSGISIWILLSCVVLLMPMESEGQDLSLDTKLSLAGRYDDNILFNNIEPIDDYLLIVNPELSLASKTELTELKANADVRFFNYLDQTDLNTIKQKYNFDSDTLLSERVNFDTRFEYVKDTLLDSELEETGRVFNLENRDRYTAGIGLRTKTTQLSRLDMTYKFYRTDYEEEYREDRDNHAVGLIFKYLLNDGRDALLFNPAYNHMESDTIESDSYSLDIGWTHLSNETGTIRIIVGGYNTEESRQNFEKTNSSGFKADINYEIEREITSFQIGYRRKNLYDASDDLLVVDQFYTRIGYRLSQRLRFYLFGNYYLTRSEFEDVDNDTRYFDVRPRLYYNITKLHSLSLSYRYAQKQSSDVNDETVSRNQVDLSFVFRFPKEF